MAEEARDATLDATSLPRPASVHPPLGPPRGLRAGLANVTRGAPHLRDGLDVRRASACLLVALLPAALAGAYNVGFQALTAADRQGLDAMPGWRGALLELVGLPAGPWSGAACWLYGLAWVVPLTVVAATVGIAWETAFAHLRGRAPSAVFPGIAALFVLMLPPGTPLWQAALGISFAVVVGLEIFGGTGRNVVHPAVVGVAFLYFTYPATFGIDGPWVPVANAEMPPALELASEGGLGAIRDADLSWRDTALGGEPGAIGETSALACLLGGLLLLHARLVSGRVVLGGALGLAATAALANALGDPARPLVGVPVHWHATLGGFAFALFYLITDPVTSATTRGARLAYGLFFGSLVVVVRVFNPAHPEGVLMAVLLANVLAPLFDFAAVRWHVARRRRRLG